MFLIQDAQKRRWKEGQTHNFAVPIQTVDSLLKAKGKHILFSIF